MKVKWNSCSKFRQTLMSTEGMTVAEATSDAFWGVGVAPNLAQQTKPSKFLGGNQMGKIQMALRLYVSHDPDALIELPAKPMFGQTSTASSSSTSSSLPFGPDVLIAEEAIAEEPLPRALEGAATKELHGSSQSISVTHSDIVKDSEPKTQVPHRKQKKSKAQETPSSSAKTRVNTLDSYVSKASPVKRKPSGEAGSPSSIPVSKSNRTDGADSVS